MSTVTTPEIPYLRIGTILLLAAFCALFLNNEHLKIAVIGLAIIAGATLHETEKAIRARYQKPSGIDYLRSHAYRYLDFFAGTAEEYRQFFAADCSEPERIVHAATMHRRTRRIYSVAAPGRHHQVLSMMRQVGLNTSHGDNIQGFVSSRGRFLNRTEAAVVAKLANQLIRKTPPENELFSEDLWDPQVFTLQQLHDKASELVMSASASQAVVTISLKPSFPNRPEMGSYQMVPEVRDSLPVIRQKLEEEQRLNA